MHTKNTGIQVTATDGDKDRPQNIVYFLTGQGIDPDNPANSKFDINRTTGEIFVLKVRTNNILWQILDANFQLIFNENLNQLHKTTQCAVRKLKIINGKFYIIAAERTSFAQAPSSPSLNQSKL